MFEPIEFENYAELMRLLPVEWRTPAYQHHCTSCVFLGRANSEVDLYFCSNEPTVVARKSSDPGDYGSGIAFVGIDPFLTLAYYRAKKIGLIK